MKPMIYADYAATTPMNEQAFEAMKPYFFTQFGNPSSLYKFGQQSKVALNEARGKIAKCIGANSDEIYFTSGGTEADNWALKAVAEFKKSGHIITSVIEHHAILDTAKYLEKKGFSVTYLPVDEQGMISLEQLKAELRPDTILISIMTGNNEVATLQPMAEIGAIAKEAGVLFHTDAVQAVGHIPVDVNQWNCDLLSFSGHKFGGPRGTGGLYVRKGVYVMPHIHGGGQERGRRSGTENVAGVVGMTTALEIAVTEMDAENARITKLGDQLKKALLEVPYSKLTGHPEKRLPSITSVVFEGVEGEALLLHLDKKGICVSSGSACSSASLDPSHVLLSLGLPHEVAHGSLRVSLGGATTQEDVDYMIKTIPEMVEYLRNMSPVWDEINNKPIWYA